MKYKLLILLFTLSSCSLVLRVAFGVKQPKPHSAEYIEKYIKKYGLNHFEHYSITEKGFFDFFNITESHGMKSSINQVIIFNKNGNLILPKDTIKCSGKIDKFMMSFKDTNVNKVLDSVGFVDVFGDSISSFSGSTYLKIEDDKPLFVLTWASYAGKLNKTNTKVWADSIQKMVEQEDINAIFLNFDFRKSWKMDLFTVDK